MAIWAELFDGDKKYDIEVTALNSDENSSDIKFRCAGDLLEKYSTKSLNGLKVKFESGATADLKLTSASSSSEKGRHFFVGKLQKAK